MEKGLGCLARQSHLASPPTAKRPTLPRRATPLGLPSNRENGSLSDRDQQGQALTLGVDVGTYRLVVVGRWPDATFEKPWKVANPEQLPDLMALLQQLRQQGHSLTIALEPSGTSGDALRQALADAHLAVQRVSPKAAHDYAEVFDGVPSQHDPKDAAVIAELAALGKSKPWPYVARSEWEQELTTTVHWLVAQQRMAMPTKSNYVGVSDECRTTNSQDAHRREAVRLHWQLFS